MTASPNSILLVGPPERVSNWRATLETTGRHGVVGAAASVREALALGKQLDPEVLITDLQLADATAIDLVRHLRRGSAGGGAFILIVAPAADEPRLLQCLSAGADSYYVDTGPGPTLASRVDEMLKGEAKMSPEIALKVLAHFRGSARPWHGVRAVDDIQNPLDLTRVERLVLVRLSHGDSVPEIARVEKLSIHEVAKCIRALYRKMSWDLKAEGLALQLI
jgi:DNA-binding NarL/FixJ family response regulator